MSAIALPFIHSSRATGSIQPVNAEKIVNYVEQEIPAINSSPDSFKIIFTMEAGTGPASVEWNYADQADMNADFAAIIVLTSAVTA